LKVFERNQQWLNDVAKKQQLMRSSIALKREAQELQECNFHPKIIGFNYNNSGLPKK
jgi:hypothetical protein